MGVGIHEAGEDDFSRAVDLDDFLAILFQPGITKSVFGCADGNKFSTEAQDSGVFYNAEFFETGTSAWARLIRVAPKRQQLADIDK